MGDIENTERVSLSHDRIKEIFNDESYRPCVVSNYTKREVYRFAEQAHNQVEEKNSGDFSLDFLMRLIGAKVQLFDMGQFDEISGSIIVEDVNEIYILISNYTSVVRDRFTIAHEIGHYVLHCPNARDGVKYIDNRFGTGRVETEANWFAAGLLVPTTELREYRDANGSDPYGVAMHFEVSGKVAEFRLNTLSQHGF